VPAVATVEGTLVHGMPAAFAGCRRSVGLGRSVSVCRGLVPRQSIAPMTTGALWKNEEGNVVSVRKAHALFAETPKKLSMQEDTSFARSRGPCTSIGTELQRGNSSEVSRESRYRGRANLRKWEEPAPGPRLTDEARLAACHRFAEQSAEVVRDA